MATPEQVEAAQMQAARVLSRILTQQGINHAFIGGFAVNVLGSARPTEDVDVMINVTDPSEIVTKIRPLLQEADSRFSVQALKLYFTANGDQKIRVTVETLSTGTLGLPCRIAGFCPENGRQLTTH